VEPSRRAALLEIVMNRRGAFLTKGCPIKPPGWILSRNRSDRETLQGAAFTPWERPA
jgi:hypothetical protein